MAKIKATKESTETLQQYGEILHVPWLAILLQKGEPVAKDYMVYTTSGV